MPDNIDSNSKVEQLKHWLESIGENADYRLFFEKSDGSNALPFDTTRGHIEWDFDAELVHFISLNQDYAYTAIKFPIKISSVSIEDINSVEVFTNMNETTEEPYKFIFNDGVLTITGSYNPTQNNDTLSLE